MPNVQVTTHQNHIEYERDRRSGSMMYVPVWRDNQPTSEVDCYFLCCPGWASDTVLQIAGMERPRWSIMQGDPHQPHTVTLSPSILHDPAKGGCGWHGWLKAGILEEC